MLLPAGVWSHWTEELCIFTHGFSLCPSSPSRERKVTQQRLHLDFCYKWSNPTPANFQHQVHAVWMNCALLQQKVEPCLQKTQTGTFHKASYLATYFITAVIAIYTCKGLLQGRQVLTKGSLCSLLCVIRVKKHHMASLAGGKTTFSLLDSVRR